MNNKKVEPETSDLAMLRQVVEWVAFGLPPLTDAYDRVFRNEGNIRLMYIHDPESKKAAAIDEAQRQIFVALRKGLLPSEALNFSLVEKAKYDRDIPYFIYKSRLSSGVQKLEASLWQYDKIFWDANSLIYNADTPQQEMSDCWCLAEGIFVHTKTMYELFPSRSGEPSEDKRMTVETRGRRPQYDWDGFHHELIRIANHPDGLPSTQADLENQMTEWCSLTWGEEPAESTIRAKISSIYQYIKKAENK